MPLSNQIADQQYLLKVSINIYSFFFCMVRFTKEKM